MTAQYDDVLQEKLEKYRKQFPGKQNKNGVEMLARSSADRHFRESGDANYRRTSPLQDASDGNGGLAGHDSIDSEPQLAQAPGPGAQGGGGGLSDTDYLKQMFAPAGGLEDDSAAEADDAGSEQAAGTAGAKKLGWGSRLWNGLKGLGGIVKNLSGYNLIRHGLFGANFRRGKVNKNFKKATALAGQIQAAAPGSDERRALENQYAKVDQKLYTNRAKLGLNRQYYTGRMMAREFTRLGRGTDLKMTEDSPGFRHFMTGGIEGGRDPVRAAQRRAPSIDEESEAQVPARREPAPQSRAEPQDKPRAKPQLANEDLDVIRAQQGHDDDDLDYDEYGNPVYE